MLQLQPHHDFFWDKVNADPAHGGQRIATVLMYLCVSYTDHHTNPTEASSVMIPCMLRCRTLQSPGFNATCMYLLSFIR